MDDWPHSNRLDRGLNAVHSMLWFTYDDVRKHKLNPSPDMLALYDRCILFLKTDLEYKWPYDNFQSGHNLWLYLCFLVLVLASYFFGFWPTIYVPIFVFSLIFSWVKDRKFQKRLDSMYLDDRYSIWPFFTAEEFERARNDT